MHSAPPGSHPSERLGSPVAPSWTHEVPPLRAGEAPWRKMGRPRVREHSEGESRRETKTSASLRGQRLNDIIRLLEKCRTSAQHWLGNQSRQLGELCLWHLQMATGETQDDEKSKKQADKSGFILDKMHSSLAATHWVFRLINNVEAINQTAVSEFSLQGLTADPALQPLIFSLFLSIYLVTTLGNLLIILVVSSETHLHTPMYFFLSILSFNDICFSTSTIPKMLMNIRTQSRSITYTGCLTQAGFVMISAFLENFLLTVMAYDRYAAICHPLRYTVIMNPRSCVLLVLVSVLINTADSLLHTLMLLQLSFCTDLGIPHFFCELAQLIKLACSDSTIDDILIYVSCCVCAGIPLSGIIYSYIHIVSSILRISSSGGKYKAFSTCGSHLSVVSLFYGAGLGVYISSAVTDSPRKTAVASVMYSVLPQMLNPFIYSIRNKDMKEALRRRITRKVSLL
ncbi:LOW QUALITY PROTEIN: olfactory receptor 7G2-like [Erethizon dorsatum]